jgi:hypothetical protein
LSEKLNEKYCTKCCKIKHINNFCKRGNICKECVNTYSVNYYRKRGRKERKKTYLIIDNKRICNTCKINKPISEFYLRKDNNTYRGECINCHIENKHIYRKNFKKEIKISRANNHIKRNNDPFYKLRNKISNLIRIALKKSNGSKSVSCMKYLPYSIKELKIHLESQFESWMNWNNQGEYVLSQWNDNDLSTWKWQIDHIIPQSILPSSSMEDENFKKCWALENLRPLSAKDNLYKSNKIIGV